LRSPPTRPESCMPSATAREFQNVARTLGTFRKRRGHAGDLCLRGLARAEVAFASPKPPSDAQLLPISAMTAGRIPLRIRGKDYEHACSGGKLSNFKNELRGCGPFLQNDPADRPQKFLAARRPCTLTPTASLSCCCRSSQEMITERGISRARETVRPHSGLVAQASACVGFQLLRQNRTD
jgi:hypothetical protein